MAMIEGFTTPTSLDDIRDSTRWLTFDCYGTLVDWEAGIRETLLAVSGIDPSRGPELVRAYIETEAAVENDEYRSYCDIQASVVAKLADRFRFALAADRKHALSDALPDWPLFPDTTAALKRLQSRYRLGILSNIDRDLFEQTRQRLGVDFDLVITAQDVESYKPAHQHFHRMRDALVDDGNKVLHVAQSLFHDAVPAAQLNIPFVWINRYGQDRPADAAMLAQFPTLEALADALGL